MHEPADAVARRGAPAARRRRPPRRVRRRGWLAALGISATLGALSGCGGSPAPGHATYTADWNESMLRASLLETIGRDGISAPLAQEIAASYWRSGELDSSQTYLEQAIAIDPLFVPSLTWLSRLRYEQGEFEAGVALLEPIVSSQPEPDPELLANLAVLRMAQGEPAAAETLLLQCIRQHPSYAPAYGNLGFLYLSTDALPRAEARLGQAIERDGSVPEFHNNLGIVYRREQRYSEAAAQLIEALKIDPQFREAHHNLALLYKLYLADDARARQHFRSYVALGGHPDAEVAALFRRDGDEELP